MALTRYGQIVGNTCVAVITFDPDITPVAEMQGNLGATLLPIADYLDGQWGVGATYNGLEIVQEGAVSLDPIEATATITDLRSQLDLVTGMVAEQASGASTQVVSGTTATGGQVTLTWPAPFISAPRVVVSARSASGSTFGTTSEVLAVSPTQVTVRVWQLRNVNGSSVQNPGVAVANASVNVFAHGMLA